MSGLFQGRNVEPTARLRRGRPSVRARQEVPADPKQNGLRFELAPFE
jgi:hypothetical protein